MPTQPTLYPRTGKPEWAKLEQLQKEVYLILYTNAIKQGKD